MSDDDDRNDVTQERNAPSRSNSPAAERQRRYRERQKEAARKQPNGSWPPFEPGNTAAVTHGANSIRFVDPLAAQIVEALLADDSCAHLREPRFGAAVDAYGRAEARVMLINNFLAGQDVEAALTEVTAIDEETKIRDGYSRTQKMARKTAAAWAQVDQAERTAARMRDALGITPAAASRMRLDVRDKYDSAQHVVAVRASWESKDEPA